MTLGNKICKNSCCALCFVCEYPGKLIEMQMGNASIPLGRRNRVFFAQQLFSWGQSSGCIRGSLYRNVKKLFYCLVIDYFLLSGLSLASEVSSAVCLHHRAVGLFVLLIIFMTYIFFFFLWNTFTVYLAWLPLAVILNGTWPSRMVASFI